MEDNCKMHQFENMNNRALSYSPVVVVFTFLLNLFFAGEINGASLDLCIALYTRFTMLSVRKLTHPRVLLTLPFVDDTKTY